MEIVAGATIGLGLVVLSVLCHHEILGATSRLLRRSGVQGRKRVLLGVSGVLLAHGSAIALFAIAYGVLTWWGGLGRIAGERGADVTLDHLYFSMMNFTTLGVGDIYPTGGLRIVSGFQALLGFVLIGWSASFTYVVMKRSWEENGEK